MKTYQNASRRFLVILTLALSAVLMFAGRSEASLVIQVQNSTAEVGGVGAFDVVLVNTGGSFDVSAFSFELSIAAGSGVSFTGATTDTALAPYLFTSLQESPFTFNAFPTHTFIASDSSWTAPGYVTLDQTGQIVGLARVSYAVASGAAVGGLAVSIVIGDGTQINDLGGELIGFQSIDGAITVGGSTAVPEPSSLIALATAAMSLGGLSLSRRRKLCGKIA